MLPFKHALFLLLLSGCGLLEETCTPGISTEVVLIKPLADFGLAVGDSVFIPTADYWQYESCEQPFEGDPSPVWGSKSSNRLEVRLLPGGVALKSLAAGPPTLVSVRSATNATTTAEHIRTTGGNPLTFLVRTNGESSHQFDLAPRYARKSKIVNVTHNPKRFADGDTITLSTVVIDIESGDTLRTLPQNQRSSIRSWTIAFGIEAQAPGGPRGTYADGYVFSRGDFVRLKYTESDMGLSGSVGFGDYPLESDRYVFYVEPASPE